MYDPWLVVVVAPELDQEDREVRGRGREPSGDDAGCGSTCRALVSCYVRGCGGWTAGEDYVYFCERGREGGVERHICGFWMLGLEVSKD